MNELTSEQKYDLIVKDLQECHGTDVLKKIIEKRPLYIYWGTAPTGRIHIGYFVPLLSLANMLKAGCQVTILIADLHALLDNLKSNEKQVEQRSLYYKTMIEEMLKVLNVDTSLVTFVKGTSYQLDTKFTFDVHRLNTLTTLANAKRAGAEVVKQSDNPLMSGLSYPILQALDEVHLRVDAQFGGIDQRKIFMYAREYLPKLPSNRFDKTLKYNKRIHLMNEMVPGISTTKTEETKEPVEDDAGISNKMSASNEKTKIDLLDGNKSIRKKINSAYCLPGDDIDNSLMVILEKVLFKIMEHREEKFVIRRKEEYGGDLEFENIDQVRKMYRSEELHPDDFKNGISSYLIDLFEPIKTVFADRELTKLVNAAYK